MYVIAMSHAQSFFSFENYDFQWLFNNNHFSDITQNYAVNLHSFPSSLTLIRCTSHTHLCVCEFHLFRTYSYFPHTNTTFKNC